MDLEETAARNDCAGEGQQQFNRPTDLPTRCHFPVEGEWQVVVRPLLCRRGGPISKHIEIWKEKYIPLLRMIVLTRASSNLLDWNLVSPSPRRRGGPISQRRTCLGQNKGVAVMSKVVSCEMVASRQQPKQRTVLESVTSQRLVKA
jgi:hypothetical protein